MLLEAARRHGVDLRRSLMVGDRATDVQAGQAVGCRCFFIDYHHLEPGPEGPFETVTSLLDAARRMVRGSANAPQEK
jgi:D-glycero-D-manno-heptose 1,7-bisphosphate phosphatase